jgi:hypothetical protein
VNYDLPSDWTLPQSTIAGCIRDALLRLPSESIARLFSLAFDGTAASVPARAVVTYWDSAHSDWSREYAGDPGGRSTVTVHFGGYRFRYSCHAAGIYPGFEDRPCWVRA